MAASRTSAAGRLLVARFEGTVLHYYNDPVGFCTLGVGHLVRRARCTARELRTRISASRAMSLLSGDLRRFERAVRAIGVPLNQNEFDALISLAYNCGEGAIGPGSTIYRMLRAGNRRAAADAFLLWRNAGGRPILLPRRRTERELFLKPVKKPDRLARFPADERRWIREYDTLKKADRGLARRRVLQRVMEERRQQIWRQAQPKAKGGDGHGWTFRSRAQRYASLKARG